MCIGVTAGPFETDKRYFWDKDKISYSYCGYDGYKHGSQSKFGEYGESITTGDEMCIELNIKNKSIKFIVNDNDIGIAYDKLDFSNNIEYKLIVSLYEHLDSITKFTLN